MSAADCPRGLVPRCPTTQVPPSFPPVPPVLRATWCHFFKDLLCPRNEGHLMVNLCPWPRPTGRPVLGPESPPGPPGARGPLPQGSAELWGHRLVASPPQLKRTRGQRQNGVGPSWRCPWRGIPGPLHVTATCGAGPNVPNVPQCPPLPLPRDRSGFSPGRWSGAESRSRPQTVQVPDPPVPGAAPLQRGATAARVMEAVWPSARARAPMSPSGHTGAQRVSRPGLQLSTRPGSSPACFLLYSRQERLGPRHG